MSGWTNENACRVWLTAGRLLPSIMWVRKQGYAQCGEQAETRAGWGSCPEDASIWQWWLPLQQFKVIRNSRNIFFSFLQKTGLYISAMSNGSTPMVAPRGPLTMPTSHGRISTGHVVVCIPRLPRPLSSQRNTPRQVRKKTSIPSRDFSSWGFYRCKYHP